MPTSGFREELTIVDTVFSALVVKLSIIKLNSSSVMSSRIHGPRYTGGTFKSPCDELVTAKRVDPEAVFGEVGSVIAVVECEGV
jgi:hypothetical protein